MISKAGCVSGWRFTELKMVSTLALTYSHTHTQRDTHIHTQREREIGSVLTQYC